LDIPSNKDVIVYLYKCLLRRKQSLQSLKPISGDTLIDEYDETISMLISVMQPDDICEADKQMRVSRSRHIDIYIDASAKYHDNPDVPNKVSVSFIIREDDKDIYSKAICIGSYITLTVEDTPTVFDITVNMAEYLALIKALEFAIDNEIKGSITIYSDSLLVVNQMNFNSSTRAPKLIVLRDYAQTLKNKLRNVTIIHLNREENTDADALARAIMEEDE
jgi:ribonuclease HI